MSNIMKATRKLIKERQRFARYKLEIVCVKQLSGGIANDCFGNAYIERKRNSGARIVSGWVVEPFDKSRNITEIVQHWWNVDADGKHFDTTPNIVANSQYVTDTEICVYGQENYDKIESCVASSLLLLNDRFLLVNKINEHLQYKQTKDLSNECLFAT